MHLIMDFKNEHTLREFMVWLEENGLYEFNTYHTTDENNVPIAVDNVQMAFDYDNRIVVVNDR